MDETKKPSIQEVLDSQPMLRRDMRTKTDINNEAKAQAVINKLNAEGVREEDAAEFLKELEDIDKEATAADAASEYRKEQVTKKADHPHNKEQWKSKAYPELPKGKLLFQKTCGWDQDDAPKEYITLQMNEDKRLIKKILDERGCLTGHPEIPCEPVSWDMPDLDNINEAIRKEFPDEKEIADVRDKMCALICKLLGKNVDANYKQRLMVGNVETKFNLREINAAVKALATFLPAKKAEMIVAKEIVKMIQNVL